MQKQLKGSP